MDSGKPQKQSLAIAYNIQRKNRKKMADGGMVQPGFKERYDEQAGHESIVDSIRMKSRAKKMAEGGMVDLDSDEEPEMYTELDEHAADEPVYDDDQIETQPEDSNEHSDDIDSDSHDMVSRIRSRLKAKRGL